MAEKRKKAEGVFGAERKPYPGELEYFKANPHVAGMATEDNAITLNPFSLLTTRGKEAVKKNEGIRLLLRRDKVDIPFALTSQQASVFGQYGSPTDIRHTILGRALSGDPSAGELTPEQQGIVKQLKARYGSSGLMHGQQERHPIGPRPQKLNFN